MSDYDDVRKCCTGAAMCPLCWKFMSVACRILLNILRDDFGFQCIFFVYSGRRGMHCWVCDERARKLTGEMRTAIADYVSVTIGNELAGGGAVLEDPLHPALE